MDLRQICPRDVVAQATVDSELALWREWADNDDRKELLPCPLLAARGASDQGGSGSDTSGMVDARGEQGRSR